MKKFLLIIGLLFISSATQAEPRVAVLPFDPIMDSVYTFWGDKLSVLDYRNALQQMLNTELGRHTEIRVVEFSDLEKVMKEKAQESGRWNDISLAVEIAQALKADYAVIGTYGEFSREIRVDARVVTIGSKTVQQGNTVTATANFSEDIPTLATRIANGLLPIITESGKIRPTSKGELFPEGDLSAYDPVGKYKNADCKLIIWTNTPSPKITTSPESEVGRCDRVDLLGASADKQGSHSCKSVVISSGRVEVNITQRGYLPYADSFDLSTGKAYRLEVNLIEIKPEVR